MKRKMTISKIWVLVCLSCLMIFVQCKNGNKSKAESKYSFIYYKKTIQHKYNCMMQGLPAEEPKTIAQFDELPLDALWDTIEKTVCFVTSTGVYKCNYREKTTPEKISEKLKNNIWFGESWIDSLTNRIRFSYYISYKNFDDSLKNRYRELRSKTDYLPQWGDSGIAYITELDKIGKWKIITDAATKTTAGLTPGFSVLNKSLENEKKKVLSVQHLLSNSTCLNQVPVEAYNIRCLDTTEYRKYAIDKLVSKKVTEYKLIKTGPKYDLIIAVEYGDTPHYTSPVLLVNKENNEVKELSGINYDQMGLFILDNYVMFANEYNNSDSRIFDKSTFKLILHEPSAEQSILIKN